ncbi:large conductance mechanosensitive channel protein MscL [Flaviflexus salsibiostraticola]|uniref:Large-conductance mechanosensitive channel n=1 Tax=Flaviflexus salsibiostraticola TaxID=1282737 RepID=A0A3Q8WX26_9ACTO|nr:large conductance mechanosensitive channel protein MscL [Flaviflexus salsibiostraticola]AZN31147.1 large conductance mechanosensitive channel protein MscL [Flaviflexus salsibiostraticola]
MIQGFKDFISRGNAIDLAVGVVIGAAFTGVVNAIVDKFFNPLVGAIFGEPNFDSVGRFTINGAEILPGAILTALVSFLLVAVALYFFIVMPMNRLAERRAAGIEQEPQAPAEDIALLTEIRDLLRETSRPQS